MTRGKKHPTPQRAAYRRKQPLHAEFMKIWEEGYVSTRLSYETMHTPSVFIVRGDTLRDANGLLDRETMLNVFRATVGSAPVFRLRLERSLFGLTPPAWVPDEEFDLSRHVIFAQGRADLATADIRRLAGDHDGLLSMRHPLWRIRVTELTNGDIAVGCMLHHAGLDGLSMMKTMTLLTTKSPEEELPLPVDPFAGARAARAWSLPLVALTGWWRGLPRRTPREAWRSYLSKPLLRRARRVAGRIRLRSRFDAQGETARAATFPPRRSAYRQVDSALARQHAKNLGGTISDLLAAATIGAWGGSEREVALRLPVMFTSKTGTRARNSVRDIAIYGDADAPLEARVASVHAQIAARDTAPDEPAPAGKTIGFTTVLPWVSRPRYFGRSEVLAVVPFPASLGSDQLAAVGVIYNGSVFIGANMPDQADVDGTLDRIARQMTALDITATP